MKSINALQDGSITALDIKKFVLTLSLSFAYFVFSKVILTQMD